MTIHQCPKCELRFNYTTELDYHCRNDHPQFHHEYPVNGVHHDYDAAPEPPPSEPAQQAEGAAAHKKGRFGRPYERSW